MTVVVRPAWHHIDDLRCFMSVSFPEAELTTSWEEMSPIIRSQCDHLLRIAEARECNIAWRRGYRGVFDIDGHKRKPEKKKECIFKEVEHEHA